MRNRLSLVEAVKARNATEAWLQNEIECLPTVARLAGEGRLKVRTYDELTIEAWKRPGSFPAQPFGDVFQNVHLSFVPAAVRRGLFFQNNQQTEASALVEFCSWLIRDFRDAWLDAPYVRDKLTPSEKNNLRNVSRFKMICAGLANRPKLYGDAFHVWTGEVNALECFLTLDKAFTKALTSSNALPLPCRPMFPSELLQTLGVQERDAMPFEFGRLYTLSGRLYE